MLRNRRHLHPERRRGAIKASTGPDSTVRLRLSGLPALPRTTRTGEAVPCADRRIPKHGSPIGDETRHRRPDLAFARLCGFTPGPGGGRLVHRLHRRGQRGSTRGALLELLRLCSPVEGGGNVPRTAGRDGLRACIVASDIPANLDVVGDSGAFFTTANATRWLNGSRRSSTTQARPTATALRRDNGSRATTTGIGSPGSGSRSISGSGLPPRTL